ncbi:MAG: ABC transporter permease [Chloroflexi bacterium]|nr:ABC transporter permease [Chloroflexota bacterium]
MQRFILERFLQMLIAVLAVSVIVFLLGRMSGDPLDILLPPEATQVDRDIAAAQLGLDKPLAVQYVSFVSHAMRGDFGNSTRAAKPVTELIKERLPVTATFGLISMLVSLIIALPIGVYAAVKRGSAGDFMARMIVVFGQSTPSFWLGLVLIYIFAVTLGWLPVGGIGGPKFYILPVITLAWHGASGIMRLTRSSMLDVLGTEYVKLARIKGVPELKVIWRHAFQNAMLPVITYSAMLLVMLLGGTVIIETVFGLPGLGRLVVESVTSRDFPVVQTVVLLLSVMYIAANFLVDIMYTYVNPKIRYG